MKRINKEDMHSQATAYRGTAVLMAIPFVLIGAFTALGGFGFIPLPGKANAPLWVIGFLGLAFFLAGSILLVHGVRGVLNQRRAARAGMRVAEPWLSDYPWDHRGIRDRAGGRLFGAVTFPIFLVVFLAPFHWWAFVSEDGPLMVKIIVGLFDLVLVLVIGKAIYLVGRYLRFGHSRLGFRRFPFHPGDRLLLAFSGTPLRRLKATLRFIEERFESTGSGNNRSTRLAVYEHFGEQKVLAGSEGAPEIEIDFQIPDNTEWVTALSGQPVRYWELVVESEQPGIDFKTTFPLPVYARF